MEVLEIPSQHIRLPKRAVEALANDRPVAVTRYGHREHVVLSAHQFSLIESLLELLADGRAVPPELLMTKEDMALAHDLSRDMQPGPGENEQIASLVAESSAE